MPLKENYMTFWEHIDELRKRIIYSIISVIFFGLVAYFFSDLIKNFLLEPVNYQIDNKENLKSAYFTPQAPFMLYISISIFSGFFFSLPVITYNILKFIKPAVKKRKFSLFFTVLFFSIFLFSIGAFFTYSILVPISLDFLISFAKNEEIIFSINSVASLLLWSIFCIGLLFQIPIIAFFLSKIGLINAKLLSKNRRYAILSSFILAAFITPPDVISQIILGLPIIILYELCIIIVKRTKSD